MRLRTVCCSFFYATVFHPSAHAIEITNFKSGLACVEKNADQSSPGWICHSTETIPITGQGLCVYNREEHPCTWYGFEFEYDNAGEDAKIKCALTSSREGTYGNPNEIEHEDVKNYEYQIELQPGSGKFFNPQYSIINYSKQGPKIKNENTVCSAGGIELFRFKFEFIYPQSRAD
ncbi:hypothetical protein [Hyphococcus sp.]|uniref:hypothetical protein n=1 Tax=Hyphococcus sp. TaxID=2038636 RepID=UPI003CCC097B